MILLIVSTVIALLCFAYAHWVNKGFTEAEPGTWWHRFSFEWSAKYLNVVIGLTFLSIIGMIIGWTQVVISLF